MHMMSAPQHQAPPQYVGSAPPSSMMAGSAPPSMMAGSAPPSMMGGVGNPNPNDNMMRGPGQGPPPNIGGGPNINNTQSPPEFLGHPGTGIANPIAQPSSLPWTVGSTDGTFATMSLMQQRNQQQPPQQQQVGGGAPWNQGGGGGGGPPPGASISSTSPPLLLQRNQHPQQSQQQQGGGGGAPWNTGGGGGGGPPPPPGASIPSTSPSSQVDPNTGAAIGEAGEATATNNLAQLAAVQAGKSLYHDLLFHQPSASVEAVLSASCEVMGFDISEMWLRTGPKTHQLTNSHLRPTALEDSVRKQLVDVYYGEKSSERTHRLSPALCKRAKDANDVVWVTAHTPHGEDALRGSISNVRTAVAVPVCHEASNTNITIIYFSIRR
jgi:hypothetical protein